MKKNLIFLGMSAKTAQAVVAARPELKALKDEMGEEGRKYVRKLGAKGDPAVIQAAPNDFDGNIVIGFNVPVNIAVKADKVIEIPVDGRSIERSKLGDALDDSDMEKLVKGLAAMANIPLRAIRASTSPITAPANEEDEQDQLDF